MCPRRTITRTVRLHKAQQAFCHSDSAFRGFVGGIGSGKSWAGAYDLLRRAKPGRLYMAAAPTYPMMRDATLRSFLSLAREFHYLRAFHKAEMVATLGNGAEVLFRSADDPDRLRGPSLSGVWLDEASLMSREAWDVVVGRLREAGEAGWCSCTFTPKGRSHFTFEVFGRDPPAPDTALFHATTWDNPFIARAYIDRAAAQYTGLLAQQELRGWFVSLEGAEWPASYFPDSLYFDDWPDGLQVRAIGLDPSKGRDAKSGDYAAFALLGMTSDGTLWCEADLFRGKSAEFLADQALEHTRAFHPDSLAVETNQFQSLFASIIDLKSRAAGVLVPVLEVNNTVPKIVRIRRLGPYLAQRRMRFRNTAGTRLLVTQLEEFPEGEHDDGCDALEMSLRALSELLEGADEAEGDFTLLTT